MNVSVVIPAYNRRPILDKALAALEGQIVPASSPLEGYEVVVVDDGSTDGTGAWLAREGSSPRVRVLRQERAGPAVARNLGVAQARFDIICFIDSDLVPAPGFLHAHASALETATAQDPRCFTSGPVVATTNFENPTSEPRKVYDYSRAYFATGNVMIARRWIADAGWFDPAFGFYGWEDLELGVRLKRMGLRLVSADAAVGYHWHPAFTLDMLPALVSKEEARGRAAVVFLRKHPTLAVRLMVQMTTPQRLLWEGLTLGGGLDPLVLRIAANRLAHGRPLLALALVRPILNRYYVRAMYAARRASPAPQGGR